MGTFTHTGDPKVVRIYIYNGISVLTLVALRTRLDGSQSRAMFSNSVAAAALSFRLVFDVQRS
jgi:hypothetical protein